MKNLGNRSEGSDRSEKNQGDRVARSEEEPGTHGAGYQGEFKELAGK